MFLQKNLKLRNFNIDELGNTQSARILHMGNDNENFLLGTIAWPPGEPPGQNMKSSISTLKRKNNNKKHQKNAKCLATIGVIDKLY